jgi:hypothetical protein
MLPGVLSAFASLAVEAWPDDKDLVLEMIERIRSVLLGRDLGRSTELKGNLKSGPANINPRPGDRHGAQ